MLSTFSKITKWTHRTNNEDVNFLLCWVSPSLLLFRSGSACSVLVRHFYDTRTQRTLVPLRPSLVFLSVLNFYDCMLSWLLQLERSSNVERSRMIVTLTGMLTVASSSPNQYMLRATKAIFQIQILSLNTNLFLDEINFVCSAVMMGSFCVLPWQAC
jgi:hypothetical protein